MWLFIVGAWNTISLKTKLYALLAVVVILALLHWRHKAVSKAIENLVREMEDADRRKADRLTRKLDANRMRRAAENYDEAYRD